MRQADGVQRISPVQGEAGALDEVAEEALVVAAVVMDLPAEETVLGRNITLDFDETQYTQVGAPASISAVKPPME